MLHDLIAKIGMTLFLIFGAANLVAVLVELFTSTQRKG